MAYGSFEGLGVTGSRSTSKSQTTRDLGSPSSNRGGREGCGRSTWF